MKYLDAAVERIHDKDPIVVVDEQPCRQLEFSRMRALGSEVIEQFALAVEDLHHAPQGIDDVQIAFGVDADGLGPEHGPGAVADLSDGELEVPGAVEYLHAEIHGIDDHQVRAVEAQFGGEIEFAFRLARLADGLEHCCPACRG